MKRILITLLFAFTVVGLSAQEVYLSSGQKGGYKKKEKKGGYDPSKLIIGGGLNFGYSGDYANFGISPKVGYKLNDLISLGVGLGYQYYKAPYSLDFPKIYNKENIIYPSVWGKCKIWGPIFAAADFEYNIIGLNGYDENGFDPTTGLPRKLKETIGVPCMLIGAGYRYNLGGRTSAVFEIMYDALQQDYSPYYQQLVYRAGIYVGL